tara:strand:+ start:1215 stop:1316 length:102 start_codon:yes stop_codon:yes gene_type:complete
MESRDAVGLGHGEPQWTNASTDDSYVAAQLDLD